MNCKGLLLFEMITEDNHRSSSLYFVIFMDRWIAGRKTDAMMDGFLGWMD